MSLPLIIQLPLGLVLAVAVAYTAYRAHALDRSGALAAALLGTIIFGLGGLAWAIVLLAFFISSSLLSRLFRKNKIDIDKIAAKGSRRDAWQVLANGGIAGICVLVYRYAGNGTALFAWLAFCASLAAANADTWATELGALNPGKPVLITSGKPVEAGTSGAISPVGTLAALGGSALIAVLGWLLAGLASGSPAPFSSLQGWLPYVVVMLAGLAASLIDSMLGATLQTIYYCPSCHKETERHPRHTCGTPTRRLRGWSWLNNDWVNGACTLSGAGLALAVGLAAPALFPPIDQQPVANPANKFNLTPTPVSITQGGAVQSQTSVSPGSLGLTSPAFASQAPIPAEYTCSGGNGSPELDWAAPPAGTTSLALIVEDPDAPGGTFYHWLLYNIPPSLGKLSAGQPVSPAIAGVGTQGRNDFGHTGYDGPCPPKGKPHRYYFRLYATDLPVGSQPPGLNPAALKRIIQGHILAQDQWMGTFQR